MSDISIIGKLATPLSEILDPDSKLSEGDMNHLYYVAGKQAMTERGGHGFILAKIIYEAHKEGRWKGVTESFKEYVEAFGLTVSRGQLYARIFSFYILKMRPSPEIEGELIKINFDILDKGKLIITSENFLEELQCMKDLSRDDYRFRVDESLGKDMTEKVDQEKIDEILHGRDELPLNIRHLFEAGLECKELRALFKKVENLNGKEYINFIKQKDGGKRHGTRTGNKKHE